MNDKDHTVIGILPPIPGYPQRTTLHADVGVSLPRAGRDDGAQNRRALRRPDRLCRLKPGVTPEQANAEVAAASRATFAPVGPTSISRRVHRVYGQRPRLEAEITQDARPVVWMLPRDDRTGAADRVRERREPRAVRARCAAIGTGAADRARRASPRGSFGNCSPRTRWSRLAGGVGRRDWRGPPSGTARSVRASFTPRAVDASVDGTVLLFALGVSIVTGSRFRRDSPALATRPALVTALKDGGGPGRRQSRGLRLRAGLVVAQVAVGFALVFSAGLLLESLYRLYDDRPRLPTPREGALRRSIRQLHQAEDAQTTHCGSIAAPRSGRHACPASRRSQSRTRCHRAVSAPIPQPVRVAGEPETDPARLPQADRRIASVDYFSTSWRARPGRPVVHDGRSRGRPARRDVNQTMAKLWGKRSALGTTFTSGTPAAPPRMSRRRIPSSGSWATRASSRSISRPRRSSTRRSSRFRSRSAAAS